jgi:quercetin dioxygenase-like cupin family protein
MRMPTDTGSDPHSHPNEQWIYLLEGAMDFIIDGKSKHATAGSVIYIPSNTIHNAKVTSTNDVVFFTVKDTSYGLAGIKA